MKLSIPFSELQFETSRSGGPGGQNVNKVETKVRLLWSIQESLVLTDAQKERLLREKIIRDRLTDDGFLSITSDTHRTQKLNREEVVKRLYDLLQKAMAPKKARIATKPTRGSKQRTRQAKEQRGQIKRLRRMSKVDGY